LSKRACTPVESIAPIGASRAMVLRNRTLPVLALTEALGIDCAPSAGTEAVVIVVDVNGLRGALQIDRIGERADVMLKPLDGILAGTPGVLGSALLGDGGILLVLDLEGLLR